MFLPGAAEIWRAEQYCSRNSQNTNVRVLPLLGELDFAAQEQALRPAPHGTRKIVLATNIAETSLTIEGVGAVVDSGLVRRSRFDPASGMSRLETLRVSRASADQRCGRAGRLGPGICYRLWSEGTQASLEAATPAEILEADLAPLALDLAAWSVADPQQLRWLDPPPQAPYEQARELLRIWTRSTRTGVSRLSARDMLELRVHPRLAHMLLRAGDLTCRMRPATLRRCSANVMCSNATPAALTLIFVVVSRHCVGMRRAVHVWIARGSSACAASQHSCVSDVGRIPGRALTESPTAETDVAGVLLAFAYPDRVARQRSEGQGRYLLSNGRGACFGEPQTACSRRVPGDRCAR